MTWDWDYAFELTPLLVQSFVRYTLVITIIASVLAAVFGLPLAVLLMSRSRAVTIVVGWVTDFIRGTPLLVQLFFLFYVLPEYGVALSPFVTGILGLGLHYACYYADIYRVAILAVAPGQHEAATALSLPPRAKWGRVLLPQALRNAAPSLANYVLVMFKESPYLALITVPEIVQTAFSRGSTTFRYLEPLTITGLIFLAVSYPTAALLRYLEGRMSRIHSLGAAHA